MDDRMSGALAGPVLSPTIIPDSSGPSGDASNSTVMIQDSIDEPNFSNSDASDDNEDKTYSTPVQGDVNEESTGTPTSSLSDTVKWALKGLGVQHDVSTPSNRKPPPSFFDLPVEVLQAIVHEIRSTNDLTALALTHSALHAIVIPQLYSRFDIVWPDPTEEDDLSTGVDALAYGLGTLAMSGNIFGPKVLQCSKCEQCGHVQSSKSDTLSGSRTSRRVVDNYAQFTRKFSLGNGPAKFVQSYYMSTECGKMLGTLVALALYRMENLEAFVWDMPTGIVREVWEALSALSHNRGGQHANDKLRSIWVRCPNSVEARTPAQNLHLFLPTENLSARRELLVASLRHIEHPSFSILPSLKSISVLEIDELAYFEELSTLIATSRDRLRYLRIGMSRTSLLHNELKTGSGSNENTFMNESSLTPLGANGALGMLMSKVCPCYRRKVVVLDTSAAYRGADATPATEPVASVPESSDALSPSTATSGVTSGDTLAQSQLSSDLTAVTPSIEGRSEAVEHNSEGAQLQSTSSSLPQSLSPSKMNSTEVTPTETTEEAARIVENNSKEQKRLKLQILALENVPLSVSVLQLVLDWTFLTDLTLLNCRFDEDLWKAFTKATTSRPKPGSVSITPAKSMSPCYPFHLQKIFTDGVSNALLAFIKDGLAPNTLVSLFLQDRKDYRPSSKVTVEHIYKSALRRHRESLQKLSIDSSYKHDPVTGSWKKWTLTRDTLAFITSGKMSNLKELALSVDYKDWHFLLQNLPGVPQLRSLYVPNIIEQVHTTRPDARELALQVLDIITLRPEIEMCYIGIMSKCFEILEGGEEPSGRSESQDQPPATATTPGLPPPPADWNNMPFLNHEESDDSSVSSADDEEDEDEEDDGAEDSDAESSSSAASDSPSSAASETAARTSQLRLREILFFTEKVEIFKIRHGTIS